MRVVNVHHAKKEKEEKTATNQNHSDYTVGLFSEQHCPLNSMPLSHTILFQLII